jgi:[ribosomal protein S18]-alanine N-acetyltransferase
LGTIALDKSVIRNLEQRDLERVRDLLASASETTAWPIDSLADGARDFQVRVAEEDGTVCGVVIFRIVADEAEILNIAVEASQRRRGTGSRLMHDVLACCLVAGARKVFLEVRHSNQVAREFYSRLAFRETGRRRNYYQKPIEDALLLVRTV